MSSSTVTTFLGQGVQQNGSGVINIHGDLTFGSVRETGHYDDIATRCLNALRVTNPEDDKCRIEDTKGGLLNDVYRWILDHPDFQKWRLDSRYNLLWIKGDPGKGKTMLLCGLINELRAFGHAKSSSAQVLSKASKKRRRDSKDRQDPVDRGSVCFFFCQATDPRLNHATGVVRSLLEQLVRCQPSLIKHILPMYDPEKGALSQDANTWWALSRALSGVLNDPDISTVTIVLDAVDECKTQLAELLSIIKSLSSSGPAKWIISSRNHLNVEEGLRLVDEKVTVCLELNTASISDAVERYVRHKVAELARIKEYHKTRNLVSEVQDYLLQNSDQTFLWVALVCKELVHPNVRLWKTREKLKQFPPGLEPLYARMMNQLESDPDADDCKRILAAICTVYRPVAIQELKGLLDLSTISDGVEADEYLPDMIQLCGSFVTIRNNTVYFVHQSAKDFLTREPSSSVIFPNRIEQQHGALFMRSARILEMTLSKNIYGLIPGHHAKKSDDSEDSEGFEHLDGPGNREVFTSPASDPLLDVKYSCVFFIEHLRAGMEDSLSQPLTSLYAATFVEFIKHHFLHWLEALSHLESIPQGILSILELERRLKSTSVSSELEELLYDAGRFIRHCKEGIESDPLQVYLSALIFSPTRSRIRQLHQHEEPQWIAIKPAVDDEWDSCVQTLEGHARVIKSLSFSESGQLIASASADSTVRIWDTMTGTCVWTLVGHFDCVNSVAFSGRRIASGSSDRTIRIWDVATGECLRVLIGHSTTVGLVAFDDPHVASSSWGQDVKVWDIHTGSCLRVLPTSYSICTSISLAGNRLAISINAYEVEVWKIDTWECSKISTGVPTKNYDRNDNRVALTSDGGKLAIGTSVNAQVWDLATGTLQLMFDTLKACILMCNVRFSPNGIKLLLETIDTGFVLDAATGHRLYTLRGHGGPLVPVLSPDGRHAAYAGHNATVIISDTNKIKWSTDPQVCDDCGSDSRDRPNSMEITRDGQTMALVWEPSRDECCSDVRSWSDTESDTESWPGDEYRRLEILDLSMQKRLHTFTLAGWGYRFRFTNTGKQIAIASRWEIQIRDVATGACVKTMKPKTAPGVPKFIGFSPDDRLMVSLYDLGRYRGGVHDSDLSIWDKETGTCLKSERGTYGPIEIEHDRQRSQMSLGRLDGTETWNISREERGEEADYTSKEAANTASLFEESTRYNINYNAQWITYGGQPFIWIPPDFRPRYNYSWDRNWRAPCGKEAIGLVAQSYKFLCMKFNEELMIKSFPFC